MSQTSKNFFMFDCAGPCLACWCFYFFIFYNDCEQLKLYLLQIKMLVHDDSLKFGKVPELIIVKDRILGHGRFWCVVSLCWLTMDSEYRQTFPSREMDIQVTLFKWIKFLTFFFQTVKWQLLI